MNKMPSRIPEITGHSLLAYIEHGQPPGGFLNAVLKGDLFEAVARADNENRQSLVDLVLWLLRNAPGDCLGGQARVDAWIKQHGSQKYTAAEKDSQ